MGLLQRGAQKNLGPGALSREGFPGRAAQRAGEQGRSQVWGKFEEGAPFLVLGNLFPKAEDFWAVQAEEGGGIRKCILNFLC